MTQQHDTDRTLGATQESTVSNKYVNHAGYLNRAMGMVPRVNKSGGSISTGNVLVDDVTTARGVTSTTNAGDLRTVYIVPQLLGTDSLGSTLTIVSNDEDWMYGPGAYVPAIDCDTTAIAIGDFIKTSATTKKATGTGIPSALGTPPPVGSFAIAASAKAGGSNGSVAAIMLGGTAGGLGGRKVATTAPTDGQVLKWVAANSDWEPGAPPYPIRATMWMDEALATAGASIAATVETAQSFCFFVAQSVAANGDAFTSSFLIKAGSYTLYVLGQTNTNRGIIDWQIDGVAAITGQDWYSGAEVKNVTKSGAVTVTGSGRHKLTGTVNGKNGSSSAYGYRLTKMWLVPATDSAEVA